MEQRDLIRDEIERLGKVLGKIIASILGSDTSEEISPTINHANEQLQSELDINVATLLTSDKNQIKAYLLQRKLVPEHIDMLSKYFERIGLSKIVGDNVSANAYLEKALVLMEISQEISKTISFDSIQRISRIKNIIEQGE